MTAPYQLSPETIALFARAEQATRESRRLIELIQLEHLRTLDGLQRLFEMGREFSYRSNVNYRSDTAGIGARERVSRTNDVAQAPLPSSSAVRLVSR